MSEPLLLGVKAAAKEAGLGRDATYRLIREGRLRAVHVNSKILIPRSELSAFIARELEGGEAVADTGKEQPSGS